MEAREKQEAAKRLLQEVSKSAADSNLPVPAIVGVLGYYLRNVIKQTAKHTGEPTPVVQSVVVQTLMLGMGVECEISTEAESGPRPTTH